MDFGAPIIIPPEINPELFRTVLERLKAYIDKAAPHSIYVYDCVEQSTFVCSQDSVPNLLGYTSPTQIKALGKLGLAELIHPADVLYVSTYFQKLFTLKKGEIRTLLYRMRRVDGTWCLLRSQDAFLANIIDEFSPKIVGLVVDISTARKSEIDLIKMSHMALEHIYQYEASVA